MKAWLIASSAALAATTFLGGCGGGDGGGGMVAGNGMAYSATSLVADTGTGNPYSAHNVDAHLVNAWGIAFNPQGFVWVANAGTSTSTLYDGNGMPQPLVVTIPPGGGGTANPTGIVFNSTTGFAVTQGANTAASIFLFASEGGTISGWAPSVNATNAVTAVDRSAGGAIYKGLAMATGTGGPLLYATDFHNGRVDVFDANFAPVALPAGAFTDPNLPAGFAPFGVQAIGGSIYVSFAKQDAQAEDDVAGAGLGAIDVFDANGTLLKRLVAPGGTLNAPWGMALAPADFGTFANALIVGNFGDGTLHAFDASTGALLGTLMDPGGAPITIDGLWGIAFGNGINAQPTNTLFFAGGPTDETHGVYGRIDVR